MVELQQLQYLVSIAEHGTLSKASEHLHVTQPALSRSMQSLEQELQVVLFERSKNKIRFNENGKIAVEYARKVLSEAEDMVDRVRAFDRSRRTIAVASCAPAPLWDLLPTLSRLYPDMTISSEMRCDETMLDGLRRHTYQVIVLPCPVEDADLVCQPYLTEQLYFSVPPTHPLAERSHLHFSDIDGENMILFSDIGFWSEVHTTKMPHSRFLVQNERFAFDELVNSSILPCFTTDLAVKYFGANKNRSNIPIMDSEAKATFYLVCLKKNAVMLKSFKGDYHDNSLSSGVN